MAIRQVLLNGSGTSGDGTTWNDLSDATSAYIGPAGWRDAIQASSAGDTVYVKGSGSSAATILVSSPATAAAVSNPVRVLACKSTTTNNQGSIVQSDLIPGLRTGNATAAYDSGDIPVLTVTGTSDIILTTTALYVYGMKFVSNDNLDINGNEEAQRFEECWLNVTGSGDLLRLGGGVATGSYSRLINCRIDAPSGAAIISSNPVEITGGRMGKTTGTTGIIGFTSAETAGHMTISGVDFSNSVDKNIVQVAHAPGVVILRNCRFPSSYSLTTGSSVGQWRIEAYGCNASGSGITTSNQSFEAASHEGTVNVETTITRTGGATDEAAGAFSHDFSSIAGRTTNNYNSLYGPWMGAWVTNTGSPGQTLTVYFTSDIGNTNSANWDNDEVWLELLYPDDAGGSKFDYVTTQMRLLATPSAVTTDSDSSWTGGSPSLTKNNQKLQTTIQAGYEGPVQCRVHFAPGANAETIYVDPKPRVV